jgi:hypothetical protein
MVEKKISSETRWRWWWWWGCLRCGICKQKRESEMQMQMQMQLISPVNAGRKEGMKGVVAVVHTSIGHERRCED